MMRSKGQTQNPASNRDVAVERAKYLFNHTQNYIIPCNACPAAECVNPADMIRLVLASLGHGQLSAGRHTHHAYATLYNIVNV